MRMKDEGVRKGPRVPGDEGEGLPPSGPPLGEGSENILDGEERRWDEENPGDDEPGEAP